MVSRRSLRSVEPCRDCDGARRCRSAYRSRCCLWLVARHATPRRQLVSVLPGQRCRTREVRCQHDRLHRRRCLASLAAHRRPGLPHRVLASRRHCHQLGAGTTTACWRHRVGSSLRWHRVLVLITYWFIFDQPQPESSDRDRRRTRPRSTNLAPGNRCALCMYSRQRGCVRAQKTLGYGLVLPGDDWGGPRSGRHRSASGGRRQVHHRRRWRALCCGPGLGHVGRNLRGRVGVSRGRRDRPSPRVVRLVTVQS